MSKLLVTDRQICVGITQIRKRQSIALDACVGEGLDEVTDKLIVLLHGLHVLIESNHAVGVG